MKNNNNQKYYKSNSNYVIKFLGISFLVFLFNFNFTYAERNYLFQWDEGSGTNMPGWTYGDPIKYGPGWMIKDTTPDPAWQPVYESSDNGMDYFYPSSYQLGGYNSNPYASIITTDRAPNTTSGGALRVYSTDPNHHIASWWIWNGNIGLSDPSYSVTSSTNLTDRMSFYIKIDQSEEYMDGTTGHGTYFHVGTYLCDTGLAGDEEDRECPREGPGQTHYYHYMFYQPDIWIHTLLDKHPTHKRGSYVDDNDPHWTWPSAGSVTGHEYKMHYFEKLKQFYFEVRNDQSIPTSYVLDELSFYSTSDTSEELESSQNDDSVTSLWIGYNDNTGKWYTGWQDMSYADRNGSNTNDDTNSTFEMRWSTNPITNSNYNSAAIVEPEWFTSPTHTSVNNGIRRENAWSTRVWTRFDLPVGVETNNNKLYFAVKDVSVNDGNAGTNWPWTKTDGHDAVSPYIHTIDYYIRPDGTSSTVRADVDNSGTTNSTDAMLTLRNSLGLTMSSTNWQASATTGDANCDGSSNSTDAMLILRQSLGLDMTGTGWCVN